MKKALTVFWMLALGILLTVQSSIGQCLDNDPTVPVGIEPTIVSGNPALCTGGRRIDPPASGTYNLDAFGNTVTVTITSSACGQVFSWSVPENIVIDQVIAKGGNQGANVYDYTDEDPNPTSDGYLHAPRNLNDRTGVYSDNYADLSHIDFCFHYKLDASKTAVTSYTRTFDWTIDKSCDGPAELTLSEGQTYTTYPFSWTASANATDSDWKVTGTITIENNTPHAATITSVSDVLSGGETGTVDCETSFPYELASGASLICSYTANLAAPYDGTNTVTVTTSTPLVEGDEATADFFFGDPTTVVDECITVTDDCNDPTQVCAEDAPYTLEYSCDIGPYEACGEYTYTNTASFTTNDQSETGSDNCTVAVTVTCTGEGCTLTQGYWKTHSELGPAPYDNTWAQLPNGANTPFFYSGKTWYQVFWTPVGGNAYYQLAHQYMAAYLNVLNGASTTTAVDAAMTGAFNYFNNPANTGSPAPSGATRTQLRNWASTLDQYNNGLIGPGHCSEKLGPADANESSTALPEAFALVQNYPNPFNPSTTFSFDLPKDSQVKLTIYNLAGQEVAVVVNGTLSAGRHTFTWEAPANLISGIYFYKLQTAEFTSVKKMIFQK